MARACGEAGVLEAYGELVSLAEELKSAEAKAKKRTIDVEEELRLMRLKNQEKEEESRRSIVTSQEQDVQGKISFLEKSLAEVSLRWPGGFGRSSVYLCFILHIQWPTVPSCSAFVAAVPPRHVVHSAAWASCVRKGPTCRSRFALLPRRARAVRDKNLLLHQGCRNRVLEPARSIFRCCFICSRWRGKGWGSRGFELRTVLVCVSRGQGRETRDSLQAPIGLSLSLSLSLSVSFSRKRPVPILEKETYFSRKRHIDPVPITVPVSVSFSVSSPPPPPSMSPSAFHPPQRASVLAAAPIPRVPD